MAPPRALAPADDVEAARQRVASAEACVRVLLAEVTTQRERASASSALEGLSFASPRAAAPAAAALTCRKEEAPTAEARVVELEAAVKSLREALASARKPEDENVEASSLDALESAMRAAAARLMDGDESAEADLDRLDKAIRAHPDHVARVAAAAAKWERDEAPANAAALAATRGLVPADVASSTAPKVRAAFERALPSHPQAAKAAAKRVWEKKALWLVHLPRDRVAKIHVADLRGRYALAGAYDIVELRAVYASLPEAFDHDHDEAKARWRDDVRAKLRALVDKEQRGDLRGNDARHRAYEGLPADAPVFAPGVTVASLVGAADESVAIYEDPAPEPSTKRPSLPAPPPRRAPKKAKSLGNDTLLAALRQRRANDAE